MGEPDERQMYVPEHPERYEQRLKKLRGPEVHEWEGALVPDPTPNWVYVFILSIVPLAQFFPLGME